MFVCLSQNVTVREHISRTRRPNHLTKFSADVSRGSGSVILWRRFNKFCTSGIVGDVMLSGDGPYGVGDASGM